MIESSSKGKAEVSAILDGSSLFLVCQTTCEVDLLLTGPLGSIFSSIEKETTCSWWLPSSNRVIKSSLWLENVMESCCPTSKTQMSSGLIKVNTVNNKLYVFESWTYWGCHPTSFWLQDSSSLSALTCLILYTSTRSWCRYSIEALRTKSVISYLKGNCIAIMIQPRSMPDVSNGQMEEDPHWLLLILEQLRQINTDEIREGTWNGPSVPDAPKQAHKASHHVDGGSSIPPKSGLLGGHPCHMG